MKASLPSWLSGLLILIVVPFFFIGGPDVFSSPFAKNIWNFGHIIFFAILMLLIQAFKPLVRWQQWLWVTVIAVALGVAIEFIQQFVGRNASVDDVLHNLFGVWLGLFWGQKPTRIVWGLRFASLLFLSPALWLVIDSGAANLVLRHQFPQVNSFEARYEMEQIQANLRQVKLHQVSSIRSHAENSLEVTLSTDRYAGLSLLGPYGDWGKYKTITMDFYNPDPQVLDLVIRISDFSHDRGTNDIADRFNRRLVLMQGWNQVRIDLDEVRNAPRGRTMRMDEICNLTIFAMQLSQPRTFYWDNVRLE
ncbi:MAG TPA: VanZ family protein [Cellvibrio sp.]|nr:VanZ family protein [Cellvibrio sp.]